VRAITLDQRQQAVLGEHNAQEPAGFVNFVGGAIMVGETMQACRARELREEVGMVPTPAKFLFVVENFFRFEGEIRQGPEHYEQVFPPTDEVHSNQPELSCHWMPLPELATLGLRPAAVRDVIFDGSYRARQNLVAGEPKQ